MTEDENIASIKKEIHELEDEIRTREKNLRELRTKLRFRRVDLDNAEFFLGLEKVLDTEQFKTMKDKVENDAFTKIIEDAQHGNISWKRDLTKTGWEQEFTGVAHVKNFKGKTVSVNVIFYTYIDDNTFKHTFLCLGDKHGPSRSNEKIQTLVKELFNIDT